MVLVMSFTKTKQERQRTCANKIDWHLENFEVVTNAKFVDYSPDSGELTLELENGLVELHAAEIQLAHGIQSGHPISALMLDGILRVAHA